MVRASSGRLLDAVRTLQWDAKRRIAGRRSGTHRASLRGRAPELTEYRRYRQGDDTRDLDWKLLARSDRAFVRLSEDRATFATWCVLDDSASMAFPEDTQAKWLTACDLALALVAIAQRAGDPVGIRLAGGRRLEATTRRDLVPAVGELLSGVTPGGSPLLTPSLSEVPVTHRVVVITDLLGDADPLRVAARTVVAAGGEVHLVHVVADEERSLGPGLVLARDPEDPAVERPVDAGARRAYASAIARWLDESREGWTAAGASYTLVATGDDLVSAVRRVVSA